jgi:zinc D-Ala-D-Ala dipeptidase
MSLVKITASDDILIDLAYGTPHNFTGQVIYNNPQCFLHEEAARCLKRASELAKPHGLRIKIFDAFRPVEAQHKLWSFVPDERYVANPIEGSPHSRGVAIDLTLVDQQGNELDMGTPFDDFTDLSHHANQQVSVEAQRNRFLLLGLMTAAGWDFYGFEWWHYQLFNSKSYPLLEDANLEISMMRLAS